MNKRILLASALLLTSTLFAQAQNNKKVVVGSQKDKHGCMIGTGYTWSEIRNNCIPIWEEKIKLKELHSTRSYTADAVVIFSDDKKRAEVFMPPNKGGMILTYDANAKNWKKGNVVLTDNGGYNITIKKKLMFSDK